MAHVRQCCCQFGREFKEFTLRGNILELAVGIIIGTAFQNVVKSLVDDIITPPFGFIFDGVDFSNLTIKLINFVRKDQPPVVIRYGLFLQQIIHLLVMALALFCFVKFLSRLNRVAARDRQLVAESTSIETSEQYATSAQYETSVQYETSEPSEEVKVLREIRDLLVANNSASRPVEPPSNLINL